MFRGHGPAYRQANAGHLNLPQLKVMSAIRRPADDCTAIGERGDLPNCSSWRACCCMHDMRPFSCRLQFMSEPALP